MTERAPTVAGSFYPADPEVLRRDVEGMVSDVRPAATDGVIGLLAPHAGYVYSGQVAAKAYRQVQNKTYRSVVIIGPSHRIPLAFSAIMPEGAYKTPLGAVEVDAELAAEISRGESNIRLDGEIHTLRGQHGEHSIEVQIPFLQTVLEPGFKIVPILMGRQSPDSAKLLARALASACREKEVLLVASSDLSHFHPDRHARELDGRILEAVRRYDLLELWRLTMKGEAEACGVGPLAAVMEASKLLGALHSEILGYATSADTPMGDRGSVVGYLAAAFFRGKE